MSSSSSSSVVIAIAVFVRVSREPRPLSAVVGDPAPWASRTCRTGQRFHRREGRRCCRPQSAPALAPPVAPCSPTAPMDPPTEIRAPAGPLPHLPHCRHPCHPLSANAAGASSSRGVWCNAPDEGHHQAPGKHAHPPPPSTPNHLAIDPDHGVCAAIVIIAPCRPRFLRCRRRLHCRAFTGGGVPEDAQHRQQ